MQHVLSQYLDSLEGQQIQIDDMAGYQQGNYIYFIISAVADLHYYYEQQAVGEFLREQGYAQLAVPIPNRQGDLITVVEDEKYLVLQANRNPASRIFAQPEQMAHFHQTGARYSYQPTTFSSYGQWKNLWGSKLTYFDNLYHNLHQERPVNRYQRLIIDTFPYLSGLTENALQYLQETEKEQRYNDHDQPTFTFQRYKNQLENPVIWPQDLVCDHPARDIAEYLRFCFVQSDQHYTSEASSFLRKYNEYYPLSIFGWRLVFARLLFPIHLFDQIEKGLLEENKEVVYQEYKRMLGNQTNYEANLRSFFTIIGIDEKSLNIPAMDW